MDNSYQILIKDLLSEFTSCEHTGQLLGFKISELRGQDILLHYLAK